MKNKLPDYIGNEIWDFGEDGDCACNGKYTRRGAYLKIKKHQIVDCGMYESDVNDWLSEDKLEERYILPTQYTQHFTDLTDENGIPNYNEEELFYALIGDYKYHPLAQKVWYFCY